VELSGRSHVVLSDRNHVVLSDRSHVEQDGRSHVVLSGRSRVEQDGRSHVVLSGRSHVEQDGRSHVALSGRNHVEQDGRSHVGQDGRSHVELSDRSHVGLRGSEKGSCVQSNEVTCITVAWLGAIGAVLGRWKPVTPHRRALTTVVPIIATIITIVAPVVAGWLLLAVCEQCGLKSKFILGSHLGADNRAGGHCICHGEEKPSIDLQFNRSSFERGSRTAEGQ
jgi:hypothetical protein